MSMHKQDKCGDSRTKAYDVVVLHLCWQTESEVGFEKGPLLLLTDPLSWTPGFSMTFRGVATFITRRSQFEWRIGRVIQ